MSKLKQILLLHKNGTSNRKVAKHIGISKGSVDKYIKQYKALGGDIDVLLKKDDPELEHIFNGGNPAYTDKRFEKFSSLLPYFESELKRKHVTKKLLWEEYIEQNPDGYRLTQFCFHLNQHEKASDVSTVLSLSYVSGEKAFIDFSGDKLEYVDRLTGEVIEVQTFVGCLPYTDYAFAICVPSQKSEDFLYAIKRMFEYFGGVTKIVVPDNLKSAVNKTDRYEPEINRMMEHMGNHYGFVTIPARAYKPKDKGLAENQVKLIYQRIYAPLRNTTFFSLEDINLSVLEKLQKHNQKRMQQRSYSREEHFLADEKESLLPLPETDFEVQYDTELQVSPNCCVYLGRDKHYYSVPYHYVGRKVKVIYTRSLVKIYHDGKSIATHSRVPGFGYTIEESHMASNSRAYSKYSRENFTKEAWKCSEILGLFFERMFASQNYPPEFFYKRCQGLLRLHRITPFEQMQQACNIALEHDNYSYKFVENVIRNLSNIEHDLHENKKNPEPENKENIRGAGYYN